MQRISVFSSAEKLYDGEGVVATGTGKVKGHPTVTQRGFVFVYTNFDVFLSTICRLI